MSERPSPERIDLRAVNYAAERAYDALLDYGLLLREWNEPDDDHTRFQLNAVLREVLEAVFRDVG